MADSLKLGIVQMHSSADVSDNLIRLPRLLTSLGDDCDLAVLPEYALCNTDHDGLRAAARPLDEWLTILAAATTQFARPIVCGGIPVRTPHGISNSAVVINAAGQLLACYDKIHLFRLNPGQADTVDETAVFTAGRRPVAFVLNDWKIGLTICYDLRFPELFQAYLPADLILCTAAFTRVTGEAHWQLLLRARAVENQCYVAGVAQCGVNPVTGLAHYGHSLTADPWGEVIGEMTAEQEAVAVVILSRQRITAVRQRLPVIRDGV